MSSRKYWFFVIVGLIGALFFALRHPDQMLSPGPLREAHRSIASDCFACHDPWRGSTSDKCVVCHSVDRIGLFTTKGDPVAAPKIKVAFHQRLMERNCLACHAEHRGPSAERANRQFSHSLLEPGIQNACTSCHNKPSDSLHSQITEVCQQCHTQERWKPATFDHSKFFLLEGDHNTACATCHAAGDFSRYTCYGCHEHSPDRVRAEHAEEGIAGARLDNCIECHRSGREEEGRGGDD